LRTSQNAFSLHTGLIPVGTSGSVFWNVELSEGHVRFDGAIFYRGELSRLY